LKEYPEEKEAGLIQNPRKIKAELKKTKNKK
jgi:hypothetical protein